MRQPVNKTGLNIVKPSGHKRQVYERFSIDPLKVNHASPREEYSKRVAACCAEILKVHPCTRQSITPIPDQLIKRIAEKHGVNENKIIRIMNDGRVNKARAKELAQSNKN